MKAEAVAEGDSYANQDSDCKDCSYLHTMYQTAHKGKGCGLTVKINRWSYTPVEDMSQHWKSADRVAGARESGAGRATAPDRRGLE